MWRLYNTAQILLRGGLQQYVEIILKSENIFFLYDRS